MPTYALLLAHDEYPTSTTAWPAQQDAPHSPCDGWAEWFSHTPLLFNLLLGDARQLPELVPCSAYQDRESLSALAAPMAGVKARWQWLKAQMEPLPAHWPAEALQQWQHIDTTITQSTRQWLLLDCATLCPHDFDEPAFIAFLQALRDQCLLWDCSAPTLPESLQILKQSPASQLGWWSPAVIARTEVIENDSCDDWPAWLADHYEERYHGAWEDDVEAYCVMPKLHPRTGLPPKDEAERDDWPMGLVTPYGRWLQRPIEGASMVFASGDHLSVRWPETAPGEGARSGLKDLNGLWVVPPTAGYLDAYAVTPHLMQCLSPHTPNHHDLYSLPGLELLHTAVSDAMYHPDEDAVVRVSRDLDGQRRMLLLDIHGRPLFDSRYECVGTFNAATGLAVAAQRKPWTNARGEPDTRLYQGVVHRSGQEIVPCMFELIERGFSDSPPKVYPGKKLLAFTHEGQPRVFNTQGKLLASPDIWCPPLHRKVQKNALLAFEGERPDAEMGMFSLKDYSFTRSGETWQDYSDALQGAFQRLTQPPAIHTMARSALIAAEDPDWMQDVARILSLGDAAEADALLQQWRDSVHHPDPEALGWDDAEDEFDPETLLLPEGENALTLYWVHLLAIGSQFARLDWKDANGLADSQWLPGASDWYWDRASEGDGMEDGFDSLAAHLAHQDLALLRLRTDEDALRFGVVRQCDAATLLERLDQAMVGAWLHGD